MTSDLIFVRLAHLDDEAVFRHHHDASAQESQSYRGELVVQAPTGDELRLVAGVGDTVFATLIATHADTARWFVTHVYVEPEAREIGIGDSILQYAMSEITARGGTWLGGQALPGDRAMKNLFERNGLVAQTIWVGKKL